MSKKLKKYQVKYAVHSIVSVDVKAENMEQAVEKSKKIEIFSDNVDHIDGNFTYIGIDDMDEWLKI